MLLCTSLLASNAFESTEISATYHRGDSQKCADPYCELCQTFLFYLFQNIEVVVYLQQAITLVWFFPFREEIGQSLNLDRYWIDIFQTEGFALGNRHTSTRCLRVCIQHEWAFVKIHTSLVWLLSLKKYLWELCKPQCPTIAEMWNHNKAMLHSPQGLYKTV